jgi:hypothetical protein
MSAMVPAHRTTATLPIYSVLAVAAVVPPSHHLKPSTGRCTSTPGTTGTLYVYCSYSLPFTSTGARDVIPIIVYRCSHCHPPQCTLRSSGAPHLICIYASPLLVRGMPVEGPFQGAQATEQAICRTPRSSAGTPTASVAYAASRTSASPNARRLWRTWPMMQRAPAPSLRCERVTFMACKAKCTFTPQTSPSPLHCPTSRQHTLSLPLLPSANLRHNHHLTRGTLEARGLGRRARRAERQATPGCRRRTAS